MLAVARYTIPSLILFVSLVVLTPPSSATAGGVLNVTRFDDPAPDGCAPGDCSLREAVVTANLDEPPNEIILSAGTYTLTLPGGDEDMSATGDLDIVSDLALRGAGPDTTTIEGDGQDRVLHVMGVGTEVTVRDLTVTGGVADEAGGGGIWNSGELTVLTSRVTENDASDGPGGGLYNLGRTRIEESTVDANRATFGGAGIYNTQGAFLDVVLSTISDNVVDSPEHGGGGIVTLGTADIVNSTLSGNTAASGGGLMGLAKGSTSIESSTIASNNGIDGVRTVGISATSLVNTIIADNEGAQCFTDNSAALISTGHNMAGDDSCDLDSTGDLPGVDPMLGPLEKNGGLTRTHRLLPGSPAIDAGDTLVCPPADQRGEPRVGTCDIGSFEFGGDTWGDVDCSGQVNPVDALQVLRYDAGLPTDTPAGCFDIGAVLVWTDFIPTPVRWGDHDCGGAADPVDALRTLRFDAGLPITPLQGCPDIGDAVTIEEPEQIIMDDDFFEHDGVTNPDIEIAAESPVFFAASNVGTHLHNIHVDLTGAGFGSCDGGDVCTSPELVAPGGQGSLVLELAAGTYNFRCDIHPEDMTGRFIAE